MIRYCPNIDIRKDAVISNKNVIEIRCVTKRFGGLFAVNEVSIHVETGGIMGLIGPNGAGKTTLLNIVAGLDAATSGSIYFNGEETTSFSPQEMCHKGLSRTFQIPQPFPRMTTLSNVLVSAYFGNLKRPADPIQYAREQLEFVEFPLSEDTLSEKLNTIQLKRLDLARALASRPRVLLLDELASGLTESELEPLMNIIRKIRDERGITVLMVEHIMHVIMGLCERLAVLNFGNLIAEGPTMQVAQNPDVIEAYLGPDDTHCED